jgi:hypothetical protein
VAEALERKRKLGQYAVVWREGRVVCNGPDAQSCLISHQPGRSRNLVSSVGWPSAVLG